MSMAQQARQPEQVAERFAAPPSRVDGFLPLRGYALIGDGRSCALVGCDGAIDWWALPEMDKAPLFGAILDPGRGGRFTLTPTETFQVSRCYADGGGALETTFRTESGAVRVTDALTVGVAADPLPWSELARRVEGLDGEVSLRWEFAPGDRFSLTAAWARWFGKTALVSAGEEQFALVTSGLGRPELFDGGFRGTATVRAGTTALLAAVSTDSEPTPLPGPDEVLRRVEHTVRHWARWRELIDYEGRWAEAVARSAVVHKQLTLRRTGGVQAAGTTSLPEKIGGSRNFDYRFSWVRDTGFALDALVRLKLRGEVQAAMSYLLSAVQETAPDVQVFYRMDGGTAPAEIQPVPLWSGYRNSAPVQVGNDAVSQRQLGAYGDLLEAIGRYAEQGNLLDGATGQLVAQIADQIVRQWTEDDSGLWELGQQRPYTSSKIGCWAALDRAVRLADAGQAPDAGAERWRQTAAEIHAYVDEACWSRQKNSYTFYAGTQDLDCATLLAARTGFCQGDDPRLSGTIDAIRAELSAGGPLLYRYTGMRGKEGAFIACSFWLVEALTLAGRLAEARELMDEMVDQANDVGLLTEEIDPDSRELLGNMPQTLSHLALISAAGTYADRAGG